jgi:hypothetical protein
MRWGADCDWARQRLHSLSSRRYPFFGRCHGVDGAAKLLPVPGGRAEGEQGRADGQGVVLQRRRSTLGRGAGRRGRALHGQFVSQGANWRGSAPGRHDEHADGLLELAGAVGRARVGGFRTEAVLLEALRVAAPAVRADRRAERANMVCCEQAQGEEGSGSMGFGGGDSRRAVAVDLEMRRRAWHALVSARACPR